MFWLHERIILFNVYKDPLLKCCCISYSISNLCKHYNGELYKFMAKLSAHMRVTTLHHLIIVIEHFFKILFTVGLLGCRPCFIHVHQNKGSVYVLTLGNGNHSLDVPLHFFLGKTQKDFEYLLFCRHEHVKPFMAVFLCKFTLWNKVCDKKSLDFSGTYTLKLLFITKVPRGLESSPSSADQHSCNWARYIFLLGTLSTLYTEAPPSPSVWPARQ